MFFTTLLNMNSQTSTRIEASEIARAAFGETPDVRTISDRFEAIKRVRLRVLGIITNIHTQEAGRVSQHDDPRRNYALLYPRFLRPGVTKFLLLVGMSSEFLNFKRWQFRALNPYLMRR